MVVTFARPTVETGTWQERVASPFTCTVHAPHDATPQPYFVPVSPSASRSTHSSGVSAGASATNGIPLTVSVYFMGSLPSGLGQGETFHPSVTATQPASSKVRRQV